MSKPTGGRVRKPRTPEQKAAKAARQRWRYANDPAFRARHKAQNQRALARWHAANPGKMRENFAAWWAKNGKQYRERRGEQKLTQVLKYVKGKDVLLTALASFTSLDAALNVSCPQPSPAELLMLKEEGLL